MCGAHAGGFPSLPMPVNGQHALWLRDIIKRHSIFEERITGTSRQDHPHTKFQFLGQPVTGVMDGAVDSPASCLFSWSAVSL